jgi:hypothetical protein
MISIMDMQGLPSDGSALEVAPVRAVLEIALSDHNRLRRAPVSTQPRPSAKQRQGQQEEEQEL